MCVGPHQGFGDDIDYARHGDSTICARRTTYSIRSMSVIAMGRPKGCTSKVPIHTATINEYEHLLDSLDWIHE